MSFIFIKIAIAVSVVFGSMYGFSYYKRQPIASFCNNLPSTASPEEVVVLAIASGLPVFNVTEARNAIVVLNQKSPFFRFSCNVGYSDKAQVKKYVSAGD